VHADTIHVNQKLLNNSTHQQHPSTAPINSTHQQHPSTAPINSTINSTTNSTTNNCAALHCRAELEFVLFCVNFCMQRR
jgi:hypothetical protein